MSYLKFMGRNTVLPDTYFSGHTKGQKMEWKDGSMGCVIPKSKPSQQKPMWTEVVARTSNSPRPALVYKKTLIFWLILKIWRTRPFITYLAEKRRRATRTLPTYDGCTDVIYLRFFWSNVGVYLTISSSMFIYCFCEHFASLSEMDLSETMDGLYCYLYEGTILNKIFETGVQT